MSVRKRRPRPVREDPAPREAVCAVCTMGAAVRNAASMHLFERDYLPISAMA